MKEPRAGREVGVKKASGSGGDAAPTIFPGSPRIACRRSTPARRECARLDGPMANFGRCSGCQAEVRLEFSVCPFCDTPIVATLGPGSVIDDRYRLETRIGAGGMGEVWRARHVHLDVARVVKLIRRDLTSDLDAQERFVREARLATRISNSNVAMLHDFATLDDGRWYMAWELIEGQSLAALIRENGPIPPARAVALAAQALDGLAAVHAAGIVHRDVSPDNIMIAGTPPSERAKIIDLGIARDALLEGPARTQAGMFLGKLKYSSPEHLGTLHEGEPLDGRADLYSMGIVLYEMLTGLPPFEETTPQGLVLSHTTRPPRRLAEIAPHLPWSPELQEILLRALEKDRENRFASAAEFAAALRAVEPTLRWSQVEQTSRMAPERTSVATPPPPPAPPASSAALPPRAEPRESKRNPAAARRVVLLFGATAAVFAGIAIAALVVFRDKPPVAPSVAASTVVQAPVTPPEIVEPSTTSVPIEPPQELAVEVEAPRPEPERPAPRPVRQPATPVRQPEPEPEPAATETVAEPAAPVLQTFPPQPGGRRFLDDRSVRRGWQRGFLPDYGALTRHDSVDWAWIAPGVTLSEYRINVSRFRNATTVEDPEAREYLDVNLQQLLNAVTTGSAGSLQADGLIWWAAESPARPRGIAIEIIFRGPDGRVLAMLRHLIRENTPADAAQEMADAVQEFVEENG